MTTIPAVANPDDLSTSFVMPCWCMTRMEWLRSELLARLGRERHKMLMSAGRTLENLLANPVLVNGLYNAWGAGYEDVTRICEVLTELGIPFLPMR